MKGVIFVEFLEMVERKFGYAMVNRIIDDAQVPTGGVYSATGNYRHDELIGMAKALSGRIGLSVEVILEQYGVYVFDRFYQNYQRFFNGIEHPFAFFEVLDSHIHVEVRKIYPEARPPRFEMDYISDREIILKYSSERRMEFFALGMIRACVSHFGKQATIEMKETGNSSVDFHIHIHDE